MTQFVLQIPAEQGNENAQKALDALKKQLIALNRTHLINK